MKLSFVAMDPVNDIARYLSSQDICLDLHVADRRALFDAIGRHIELEHAPPHDWVVQSLWRREKVGCTDVHTTT